jgi:hypothetical protein
MSRMPDGSDEDFEEFILELRLGLLVLLLIPLCGGMMLFYEWIAVRQRGGRQGYKDDEDLSSDDAGKT